MMQGALLGQALVLNHREVESASLPAHVGQFDLTSKTLTQWTDVGDLRRDWFHACVEWDH